MIGRGRARLAGAGLAAAGLVGGLVSAAPPALAAGSAGTITTVAGGPGRGPALAVFQEPAALAAGPGGAVYVGDRGLVRKLTTTKPWEPVIAGVLDSGSGPLYSGNGGAAVKAWLRHVTGLAVDAAGNVVIADSAEHRVRVVAASTGTFYGQAMTARHIYTIAGNGKSAYSGDGGPATSAGMTPFAVAVDPAGNLVIADASNARVRVVAASAGTFYGQAMTAGDIYTIAGNGTNGYSGDGGPATSAELFDPAGVSFDTAGNLVIAATGDAAVRVVAASTGTFYGQAMTAGDIYTVAGNGTNGYSGDGGPATSAELNAPYGVAVDAAGNLVIADSANARVRVVAVSAGTFYGQAMTAGDIYTIAGNGTNGYSGNGGPATSAELSYPEAPVFDAAGNLVFADVGNDLVRVVAASAGTFYGQAMTAGDIYTVAGNGTLGSSGSGGPAVNAELARPEPSDVTVDSRNYVVVQSLRAWFICETAGTYFGRAMTAGDIYAVAGSGKQGYRGDGGPALSAKLNLPMGVAVDADGNLLIADTFNNRVRVVAASTGTFYRRAMTAGDIYTIAGNGKSGYSGDGGPATLAQLYSPDGVAVDAKGNLVMADSGNDRVRVVAASTGTFYGRAMTAGDIYTIAGNGKSGYSGDGGPATSAELGNPGTVAMDASGNLVIADTFNNRVRVVAASTGTFYGRAMTAGDIYTIAGNGKSGYSGDGGPATSAELSFPQGVAVDGPGNLVIADTFNNRVRVVAASTGTFYGQAMTAGDIYTVAGNGTRGYSGDGGPATSGELEEPDGVAVNGSGNLVIADTGNGLVRLVSG